jgi:DNA anti-recombination protein RmuC
VILLGLRGMKVEERAKEILARITGLQSHLKKLFEDFDTLGKHINNAHANFDKASKKLEKFSDAMTTLLESGSSEEKLIESGT